MNITNQPNINANNINTNRIYSAPNDKREFIKIKKINEENEEEKLIMHREKCNSVSLLSKENKNSKFLNNCNNEENKEYQTINFVSTFDPEYFENLLDRNINHEIKTNNLENKMKKSILNNANKENIINPHSFTPFFNQKTVNKINENSMITYRRKMLNFDHVLKEQKNNEFSFFNDLNEIQKTERIRFPKDIFSVNMKRNKFFV